MHSPHVCIICEATATFPRLLFPAFSWRRETIQCGWAMRRKNCITQCVQISAVLHAQDAGFYGRRMVTSKVRSWGGCVVSVAKELDTGWAIQCCKCSAWVHGDWSKIVSKDRERWKKCHEWSCGECAAALVGVKKSCKKYSGKEDVAKVVSVWCVRIWLEVRWR